MALRPGLRLPELRADESLGAVEKTFAHSYSNRQQRGRAAGMQFVFANLELVLNIGALALVAWFSLPGHQSAAVPWLTGGSNAALWMATLVYAAVVLLVEPFFVGAGFSMYLNRRVQLEAWDVEQEFRRAFG